MAGEREERMKSVIGLKNVVIAQLLTDTDEETTYDTPEAVEGAIDMSITPNNADPDVQYADDIEFDGHPARPGSHGRVGDDAAPA